MKKVNEIKQKVSVWCAEHPWDVGYWTGGMVAIIGSCAGVAYWNWKYGRKAIIVPDEIKQLLKDANQNITDKSIFAALKATEAIKPEELGKLGEQMLEAAKTAGTNGMEFTHFLAIGTKDN